MNPIRRPAATRAADVAAPARHRLVLPALCIAVLIAQIDTAIVNLATEPIGTAFGARVSALQWVIEGRTRPHRAGACSHVPPTHTRA